MSNPTPPPAAPHVPTSGGERNIFGTIYELLILRELASSSTVDVELADRYLALTSDSAAYKALQSLNLVQQAGDADFATEDAAGLVIVQLKASLVPANSDFNKGHLNTALKQAVVHVLRLLNGQTKHIPGFFVVSNRALGNIHDLPHVNDVLARFAALPIAQPLRRFKHFVHFKTITPHAFGSLNQHFQNRTPNSTDNVLKL